jgi:hypothetical protein
VTLARTRCAMCGSISSTRLSRLGVIYWCEHCDEPCGPPCELCRQAKAYHGTGPGMP